MVQILKAAVLAVVLLLPCAMTASASGLAEEGLTIANAWCANCHVVSNGQAVAFAAVPTSHAIAARYADNMDVLGAFLADPHPVMPNMSLTRQEIAALVAYIGSLR